MQKLHPKAVWLFFFSSLFRFFFLIFPLYFVVLSVVEARVLQEGADVILKVVIGILLFFIPYAIFCYIWARLTYRYWGYELTEHTLKIEKGVIWKKYISIPYQRIQNVDIYRGLIARILGLSDLQVQTAGYSAVYGARGGGFGFGAEGRLPGLSPDVAEELRENLTQRVTSARQNQGL